MKQNYLKSCVADVEHTAMLSMYLDIERETLGHRKACLSRWLLLSIYTETIGI